MLALATPGTPTAQTTAAAQPPAPAQAPAQAPPVENKFIASPQPGALDVEKAHIARYDAAISAVRRQEITAADTDKLKQSMARVGAGDPAGAKALRDQIVDPLVRKMADWYRLRGGFGEAREYADFLASNPVWASRETLVPARY